jgi:hypothetical protein
MMYLFNSPLSLLFRRIAANKTTVSATFDLFAGLDSVGG